MNKLKAPSAVVPASPVTDALLSKATLICPILPKAGMPTGGLLDLSAKGSKVNPYFISTFSGSLSGLGSKRAVASTTLRAGVS